LGLGVCPTVAFGKRRHFTDFIQVGSSNEKNVEDLQKQVESLGEKLIGYEKTKEQLTQATEKLTQTTEQLTQTTGQLEQTQHHLAIMQKFMQHKFGDELSMFINNVPPS
jgi:vacuolar-type H+-ATPase subunit I/STV1